MLDRRGDVLEARRADCAAGVRRALHVVAQALGGRDGGVPAHDRRVLPRQQGRHRRVELPGRRSQVVLRRVSRSRTATKTFESLGGDMSTNDADTGMVLAPETLRLLPDQRVVLPRRPRRRPRAVLLSRASRSSRSGCCAFDNRRSGSGRPRRPWSDRCSCCSSISRSPGTARAGRRAIATSSRSTRRCCSCCRRARGSPRPWWRSSWAWPSPARW